MTLSTVKGRLQTKVASYSILGLITLVFMTIESISYGSLFGIAAVVGLILETIWGHYIDHEPGWLTICLGIVEFMAISAVATVMVVPIPLADAARYYVISWIIIQLFFIYIVPIWRLKWTTDGSELW